MKGVTALAVLLVLGAALCGCSGSYLPATPPGLGPSGWDDLLEASASRYFVPFGLVRAVMMAESAGNASALSPAGAQGLMQLMPGTARGCGIVDPFEPVGNVDCGTRYLGGLLRLYKGNKVLAVAAYNAGPGAVNYYHGIPPYAETRAYVKRVISSYAAAGAIAR